MGSMLEQALGRTVLGQLMGLEEYSLQSCTDVSFPLYVKDSVVDVQEK